MRKSVVVKTLEWLKINNKEYADIKINYEKLEKIHSGVDGDYVECPNELIRKIPDF